MDYRLQDYLEKGARGVPGWLHEFSARFIADLSQLQQARGLAGSTGEIGVHMGRLFILLRLAAAPGEKSFAVDVFGDQHLNLDRSGAGDQPRFLANVSRWTGTLDGVVVIQKSSLDVHPEEILSTAGRCRLASVDGGHTAECALNDMRLMEAVLQEHGIVILDDYFNPSWPDVSTGVARYALDPATRLRPFAISPGKVYFARPDWHEFYRAEMCRRRHLLLEKHSRMFGCEVDIYGAEPGSFSFRQRLKKRIRATPVGAHARRLRKRLKQWAISGRSSLGRILAARATKR